MTYQPIRSTDHEVRGPRRLLEQFKERPKLEAWLGTYLRQVQKLEDATWEVIDLRLLDAATGIQLDRIGKIVGRGRGESPDDLSYRQAIRAQIRINRSEGTPLDLAEVADLSVPDDTASFIFRNWGNGFVQVYMNGQAIDGVKAPIVFDNLRRTKAAGVRLHLVWSPDPPQTVFRFGGKSAADLAPGSYVITRTDRCFSCVDVGSIGGNLASVIAG